MPDTEDESLYGRDVSHQYGVEIVSALLVSMNPGCLHAEQARLTSALRAGVLRRAVSVWGTAQKRGALAAPQRFASSVASRRGVRTSPSWPGARRGVRRVARPAALAAGLAVCGLSQGSSINARAVVFSAGGKALSSGPSLGANPSIERTAKGVPPLSAAHVER